jgi:thermitase
MRARTWLVVGSCLWAAGLPLTAAAASRPEKSAMPPRAWRGLTAPPAPAYVPGEVLVKFRDRFDAGAFQAQVGATAATREEAVRAFHVRFMTKPDRAPVLGWQRIKLPAGQRVEEALPILKGNALVEAAEPNYRVFAAADLSTTYTPYAGINDPYYNEGSPSRTQWWFNRTRADYASTQTYTWLGSLVTVAVLDTGLQANHPDLAGRTITGYSAVSYTASTNDDNLYFYGPLQTVLGHGTHAAGIIAANTNNGTGGVGTGFRSGVRVMPVKVLDYAASGTVADLAEGVTWATDHGAKVLNLSLGVYGANPAALDTACTYAITQGMVLVAAAGNNNLDLASNPYYPAVYTNVLSVAATDSMDYVTIYSNWGSGFIDVSAPGGTLEDYGGWGRDFGVTTTAMGSTYSAVDGTSFACPQVSALAALLLLKDPNLPAATVRSILTSPSNNDNPYSEQAIYIGAGRINVAKALAYSTPPPSATRTATRTRTVTPTRSATHTVTPTRTVSPTRTVTRTITPSPTVTPTRTVTPTVTPMSLASDQLLAYPQPGRDRVRLAYRCLAGGNCVVNLYNPLGERVLLVEETPYVNVGTGYTDLNTSQLAAGVYFLHLTVTDATGERTLKKRVVITR